MKKVIVIFMSLLLLVTFTFSAVAEEFFPIFGIDVSVFQGSLYRFRKNKGNAI